MNTEWKLVPNSIHELIRSGDLETLLWKLNGVHEAESVRLALYGARQSMLSESASDESLDKKEIEKWKRDSKLLEAIQDGCWDVRFLSSSNGDVGDYNIGIEIVAHFMEKPQERVIGEDWNENLRTALEQAMTAEAYPPARPAPTSHPIPTGATGDRDWELCCNECNGSGHVFVKHQVAERKTDVQEFKEECEACEGRGFNIAFEDIPGIADYVKSCGSDAGVTGEDEQSAFERWLERTCPSGDVESVQRQWEASSDYADFHAPAAGDALKPDFERAEQIASEYVQDYEWRGEDVAGRDTCYTPSKRERAMITDAILGLLAEPEFIAAIAQQKGEA